MMCSQIICLGSDDCEESVCLLYACAAALGFIDTEVIGEVTAFHCLEF